MRAYHPERDFYAVLSVPSSANAHEIRSAFRKVALQYHPDKNPNNPEAAQRFMQAREAYEVLGDPDKRRMYDSYRGSGNGFSASDLSSMFRERTATTEAAAPQDAVLYNGLYWEPRAYQKPGKMFEKWISPAQSHQRIINAGYERHPYANEVFSLLCDGLEGKLQDSIRDLYEDINTAFGDWFADKVETRESSVRCYRGTEITEFSFDNFFFEHSVSICDLPDDFVAYWWSKPFVELPQEIQTEAYFCFSVQGNIWPMGRGFGGFGIYTGSGGSRGVRSAKKISDGNEG